MFSYLMTAFTALLFFVLTPGVLLTIPSNGSKIVVAVVHGIVFALVYYLSYKTVWALMRKYEGFQSVCSTEHPDGICPANYSCAAGYCVSKFR